MDTEYRSNPQLELAATYAHETNRHLFITGRAGTGKTTFLRKLIKDSQKQIVVVAPTGVAAMHAGGSTIHRFFQLPFGVIAPGGAMRRMRRMRAEKVEVIRRMDLLIIDESSMVRPDVLDGIDEVLRHYRQNAAPFGGVQVIMIGDLYQLPPVLRNEDRRAFDEDYRERYFFGSKVLEQTPHLCVELTTVYRQREGPFLDLLNAVRENRVTDEQLRLLNARHQPAGPAPGEERVTLCSHRRLAREINESKLGALPGPDRIFRATINRKFPEANYPNDPELRFRVGAQVMFNKNDTDGRWYNGKIGTIVGFRPADNLILVRCGEGTAPIAVEEATWENVEFGAKEGGQGIESNVAGTYTQHPLTLAWGITIHKSQGLTFDRVDIDAADSFDHGQVYVALSRCRTLEGITLRHPLTHRSIRTDARVGQYARTARVPTEEGLGIARQEYRLESLRELYHFAAIRTETRAVAAVLRQFPGAFTTGALAAWRVVNDVLEDRIIPRAGEVRKALATWRTDQTDPTTVNRREEQLTRAAGSLAGMMREDCLEALQALTFRSDNRTAGHRLTQALNELRRLFRVKLDILEQWRAPFSPADHLRVRTAATEKLAQRLPRPTAKTKPELPLLGGDLHYPELYQKLEQWRRTAARRVDLPPHQVIHLRKLIFISEHQPDTIPKLLRVPGVGKRTCERYGREILSIVRTYREGSGTPVSSSAEAVPVPFSPKLPF